jgi:GR25 family glycosyltransferase involved in LPS biosynthesis
MKRLGKRYWIVAGLLIFFIATLFINVWIRKEGFENKNYMDGVDAIYWINLDRSKERRDNMIKVLEDPVFQNVEKIRVSATDGKDKNNTYKKIGNYNKQDEITDYEYACLISHLDSINEFSRSNYNNAIIFEDDITLEFMPFWDKSIKDVMDNAPSDWEIIMLWYNVEDNGFVLSDYEKFNKHYYALAYLINKKGAKRLIEKSFDSGKYNLVDDYSHKSDYYIYGSLNTYVYKYPYFVYKTDNDSEIHQDHISKYHVKSKNNALNAYNKMNESIV